MKTMVYVWLVIFLLPSLSYAQNDTTQHFTGSWLGKISAGKSEMRGQLKINFKSEKNSGFIEFPFREDIPMDKIWTVQDSVFANVSNSLGQGTMFRGLIMPGDSVINGLWFQNGSVFPLALRRIGAKKANFNPVFEGYKIIKLVESTPLKFQQLTQTCWSFATTSFIETEAIRSGKSPVILSPMFFVIPTYIDKAEKNIRMNGTSFFGEGDLTFSVMKAYTEYGAIPEIVYSGKTEANSKHDHREMNGILAEKVRYYVKTGRGNMTTEGYRNDMKDIISTTMGKAPDTFLYGNKKYTPISFAKENIGINPGDYVEITSFSHHPFYSKFILEIESNWNNNYYLNVPLDDFTNIVDYALLNNYSLCWDGDVYEGYNNGFAVLISNKSITQQARQAAFDNRTTEDIHNMHIIGIAENGKGNRFYVIKNSSDGNCGGYMYMSKEYLQLKTISIMVNKGAIPQETKNKFIFTL